MCTNGGAAQENFMNVGGVPRPHSITLSHYSFFFIPLSLGRPLAKLQGHRFAQLYRAAYLALSEMILFTCLFTVRPSLSLTHTHMLHDSRNLICVMPLGP